MSKNNLQGFSNGTKHRQHFGPKCKINHFPRQLFYLGFALNPITTFYLTPDTGHAAHHPDTVAHYLHARPHNEFERYLIADHQPFQCYSSPKLAPHAVVGTTGAAAWRWHRAAADEIGALCLEEYAKCKLVVYE